MLFMERRADFLWMPGDKASAFVQTVRTDIMLGVSDHGFTMWRNLISIILWCFQHGLLKFRQTTSGCSMPDIMSCLPYDPAAVAR